MINDGTTVKTWMIEFALRSNDKTLLDSIFDRKLPGMGTALVDTIENLVSRRRDSRICDLLEAIGQRPWLNADKEIRRTISKALLAIGDSLLSHTYAMESIRFRSPRCSMREYSA